MHARSWVCDYISAWLGCCHTAMALSAEMELYGTPASRLDSFVAQCLQPSREWKEEVLEAVKTVEQSLREEPLEGECGLDQEVRVLKLVKVRRGFSIPGQGGHTQHEGMSLSLRVLGTAASLSLAHAADVAPHPTAALSRTTRQGS